MRKYWFGKVEIGEIVKKMGLIAIVGALFATYFAVIKAMWIKITILVLLVLLVLYVLWTCFAIFYVVDDDELHMFCMWRWFHFELRDIKRIEFVEGKSTVLKPSYGWGRNKIRVEMKNGIVFFISPKYRKDFADYLKEKMRKGITFR